MFHQSIPFATFGGLSLIAALSFIFLPETCGIAIPETLEEGENLGK